MPFSITIPTRHTDTFAATGFVHGGTLIALTEMAYAAFEEAAGYSKPATTVAVQRETRVTYAAPLPWRDGAAIEVTTSDVTEHGYTQQFVVRSAASGRTVATIVHRWAWLDTTTGRPVAIPADVRAALGRMDGQGHVARVRRDVSPGAPT